MPVHIPTEDKVELALKAIKTLYDKDLCHACYMDSLGIIISEIIHKSANPKVLINRLRMFLDYREQNPNESIQADSPLSIPNAIEYDDSPIDELPDLTSLPN